MQWEHTVDRKWLEARRDYITASDIVSMLPMYRRFVKAYEQKVKDTDPKPEPFSLPVQIRADLLREFIKYYLSKSSKESVITRSPSNDAARGHVLEPYAVDEYNNEIDSSRGDNMYHWDDALIYREDGQEFPLAYSPDATNVEQPYNSIKFLYKQGYISGKESNGKAPTQVLEIKSYGKDRHATTVLKHKNELEERYQIATAMCVCDSITKGHLCLYNPNSVSPVEIRTWTKENLIDEMATVEMIHKCFNESIKAYHHFKPKKKSLYTEREIHAAYMKEQYKEGALLKGE